MTKLGPFISLVLIILSNCKHTTNTLKHHEMNALEGRWKFDTVQRNVELLMVMTEEALVLRQQAISFVKQIEQGTINPDHLSSQSLRSLSTSLSQYLTLRKKMLALAKHYQQWDDDAFRPQMSANVRLLGVMVGLASALVLFDNYNAALYLFQGNAALRRQLNEHDRAYAKKESSLLAIGNSFYSIPNRSKIRQAMKRYKRNETWIRRWADEDNSVGYLHILIEQSPSTPLFRDRALLTVWTKHMWRDITWLRAVVDATRTLRVEAMNGLSKLFGNGIGLLPAKIGRQGRLTGALYRDSHALAAFKKRLTPLDILLEKTPFRLTDKFIPGFFGHVAVWLGTQKELEDLGVWSRIPEKYQRQIQQGKSVLEALRDGVQLNTIDHFLNVDDAAILSSRNLTLEQRRMSTLLGFGQIGKAYDFNFDVATQDRIVCSELAFVLFPYYKWPRQNVLGRDTISPDHVSAMALNQGPLQLSLFYIDGKKVSDDLQDERFAYVHRGGKVERDIYMQGQDSQEESLPQEQQQQQQQ